MVICKGGGHHDMHLEINVLHLDVIFHSYYIVDSQSLPLAENHKSDEIFNIRVRLEFLLNLLKEQIATLKASGTAYFPIVLDDQFSYGLRLEQDNNSEIRISFGSTRIEGWRVDLSRPELYSPNPEEYNMRYGPAVVRKADFINAIDTAIEHMKNVPYVEPSIKKPNIPPGVTTVYPKPGKEE